MAILSYGHKTMYCTNHFTIEDQPFLPLLKGTHGTVRYGTITGENDIEGRDVDSDLATLTSQDIVAWSAYGKLPQTGILRIVRQSFLVLHKRTLCRLT
ncbi:uncharacterized protein EAE97_008445 [Botrytis byssoidea]|uniref:Uncharacterized protein n=1 Tax=Botrytis byssoidea TaxID=139641 RepID=A0A9P5LYC0_9HELO|nr:uncharacterized protein EAE97_008445 [Botrytis byssoidea]KAF7934085.1 hypothetical protein EAE97_008445 [Botrytis byssoidea]